MNRALGRYDWFRESPPFCPQLWDATGVGEIPDVCVGAGRGVRELSKPGEAAPCAERFITKKTFINQCVEMDRQAETDRLTRPEAIRRLLEIALAKRG